MLVDEVKHRNNWKVGRIQAVSGDDSHIRTVEVQVGARNGKTSKRDITKVVAKELD